MTARRGAVSQLPGLVLPPAEGPSGRGDDDILGFDVPVDDGRLLPVEVGQGLANLLNPGQGSLFAQWPGLDAKQMIQAVTFDKIHHQVLVLA